MRLTRRIAYGAQMALVLLTAAALVGVMGLTRARAAPSKERPAVERPAPVESPPAFEMPADFDHPPLARAPAAEQDTAGRITGDAARQASGDLDRYGGHGSERAAVHSSKNDGPGGALASSHTTARASPRG